MPKPQLCVFGTEHTWCYVDNNQLPVSPPFQTKLEAKEWAKQNIKEGVRNAILYL